MAITQTQALPAPFITALGEKYGTGLAGLADQPFTTAQLGQVAPQVAGQTALQQQATTLAGTGVGAYQPFLTAAGAQGTAAGTTLGGVSPYIGAAGTQYAGAAGLTGAGANLAAAGQTPTAGSVAEYMSPYQSQVIDTTLAEFDRQAAARQQSISDAAVSMGGYGGGREGVMQSEYQLGSDRNRAMIEAQLQQQGFGQAQAARQADMAARLGIGGAQQQYAQGLAGLGQAQLGLGSAQQALAGQQGALAQGYLQPGQFAAGIAGQQAGTAGQRAQLAQAQLGAGQALQGMQGTDISRAGQVGALDQAYVQAVKDAEREQYRMGLYEPMERLGWLGTGLSGLMQGMAPQYQFSTQPNPSPLATALGIAATGVGAYKAFQ